MEFVPFYHFNQCVKKYQRQCRAGGLTCWEQFLAMAFGQLTYRESLRDVVICLKSQPDKLYHLGFHSQVARSTLARINEKNDWRIYRDFAEILIKQARALYSDGKEFNLEMNGSCYVIDSTTIELCLNVFQWARLVKARAAIKLHLSLDLTGNIPAFFDISSAKIRDTKFLDIISIEAGAYYIMDRGYIELGRLYHINEAKSFFVIRAKSNLKFRRLYSIKSDKATGVKCDQIVKFVHYYAAKKYPDKIRRIKYFDKETEKNFVFLTNDFNIEAKTVADLYKHRWQVELFFKWIKQHLKIKAFWGYSENAVKTQICIAISVYLLVAIIKKKLNINRNLYEILQILSVSPFDKSPIIKLISEICMDEFQLDNQKQAKLRGF